MFQPEEQNISPDHREYAYFGVVKPKTGNIIKNKD